MDSVQDKQPCFFHKHIIKRQRKGGRQREAGETEWGRGARELVGGEMAQRPETEPTR